MIARHSLLFTAALAAWTLSAAVASAQTTLRYKFKEGDNLKYALEQKLKMSMNIMGKVIDMNMEQVSDMTWQVQSVDGQGAAKVAIKFGRNKLSMDTPMGKIEVDSKSDQEPDDLLGQTLSKVIKALAGLEVTATISPLGEYTDIKIPEKQLKALQDVPGAAGFGDLFSADGLKRMMSQSGLVMPKDPVSKGSKWKSKVDMKLPIGKMIAEVEYNYAGPTDKDGRTVEKIALKPSATLEPDPNAPFVMKLKSQEGSGTALFDNHAGRLLEISNQQTMEMEAELMGMAFTQRMVQNVTLRLVEKK